jgi:hypothetical protein
VTVSTVTVVKTQIIRLGAAFTFPTRCFAH